MFRPFWAILRSQNYIMRKNYTVLRSLVVVHIVNFQQDIAVMRLIHIELIICSASKVDRVKVYIYIYIYIYTYMVVQFT